MDLKLKVLTYNIHKGFPLHRRKYVLAEMRQAIRSTKADLVLLQEILGHHPKEEQDSLGEMETSSQLEYLADTIWTHFAYGKNAVYTSNNHGNALLSRYPIIRWENIDISTNRYEKRGLLHAEVGLPDWKSRFHVLCVHLDLTEKGRQKQVQQIIRRVKQNIAADEPLILAGDFNDWLKNLCEDFERELGLREAYSLCHGQCAKTFPSWWPLLSLDRIYIRGFEVSQAEVISDSEWRDLSDHRPLAADLILPQKPER